MAKLPATHPPPTCRCFAKRACSARSRCRRWAVLSYSWPLKSLLPLACRRGALLPSATNHLGRRLRRSKQRRAEGVDRRTPRKRHCGRRSVGVAMTGLGRCCQPRAPPSMARRSGRSWAGGSLCGCCVVEMGLAPLQHRSSGRGGRDSRTPLELPMAPLPFPSVRRLSTELHGIETSIETRQVAPSRLLLHVCVCEGGTTRRAPKRKPGCAS